MATNPKTQLVPFDAQLLYHVKVLCTRKPKEDVGPAIVALRTRAGFSQAQLGHHFRRKQSRISDWEAGKHQPAKGMTVSLLEFLQVPRKVREEFIQPDMEMSLDSATYAKGDAVEIEYAFFQRTRGKVLQALYDKAQSGSESAVKIYQDWMQKNELSQAEAQSTPRLNGFGMNNLRIQSSWTALALKPAEETFDVTPTDTPPDTPADSDL